MINLVKAGVTRQVSTSKGVWAVPNSTLRSLFFAAMALICLPLAVNAASVQSYSLDQKNQTNVQLTLYNEFALVQDTRSAALPRGRLLLEFKDVAKTLKPTSVVISNPGKNRLEVIEQSYRYDSLNRDSLLETYIGRKLKYSRSVLRGESYEKVLREGVLLSINPEIVDFGDEIEISPEGVISLPDLPEGLTLSPTLVWLLDNERGGEQAIHTRYLANAISWQADYVLTLDEKEEALEMNSWATIRNDSGAVFNDASIRLIAGSVNQVFESAPKLVRQNARASMMMSASDSQGISISETNAYQAFDLPNRTTLLNHETKQLNFLKANKVPYVQTYRLRGQVAAYQNTRVETPFVVSEVSIHNLKKNGLGLPLARGTARVYGKSGDFLGGATLRATPQGQKVVLELGKAFDITAERAQTQYSRLGERTHEASYKITLHNARSNRAMVEIDEMMQGDWKIQDSSDPIQRVSNQLARVKVEIPAGKTKIVTYTVRVKN